MRYIAAGVGSLVLLVALILGIWAGVFGLRWFTAGPSGALIAREQILSGPQRIAAYNHFFNLCASIQGLEGGLAAAETAQKAATTEREQERQQANLASLKTFRAQSIAQYNADAAKDYTIGQFRDLDLPFQISLKESTQCAS